MMLALITLLPAKLGGLAYPNCSSPPFPDKAARCNFCHRAGCRKSLGEDLHSAQGQDINKMTGKSLGPWLSREIWSIINHTGHLNAAGFNAKGKN